jgi:hypothetical protein
MKSRLDIPLAIDAVEPLSSKLRYSTLYPPLPHLLLGGLSGQKRASGEALELPVCPSYNDRTCPLDTPGTAVAGFLRFLNLLASRDWAREPLIIDPQQ